MAKKKQRLSQQEQEAQSTPKKTPHSKNQVHSDSTSSSLSLSAIKLKPRSMQTTSSRDKLSLNKGNTPKKLNLGQEEHSHANKSKEKEALSALEEEKVDKTNYPNPVVILGLPIDDSLVKKRRKTEAKKQHKETTRVVMVDDENDSDKGKGKGKEKVADVVMAEEENDVNSDCGDDHNDADVVIAEDDNDNRSDKGKGKGKEKVADVVMAEEENDVNSDCGDDHNDADVVIAEDDNDNRSDKEKGKEAAGIMEEEENDTNVAAAEDEKVNESDEKHTLWQKYPCVLASMKQKLSFMNENVSDFSGLCQDIMEKADQGKLKDWESRWRNQNKVQLETFAAKKTLENEEMKQWLDILQG